MNHTKAMEKTRKLTMVGILSAISIFLGLTPLGFIPLGGLNITIMHIPVIVGSLMEGPLVGMSIGLIFGIFSMVNAVLRPSPLSFVFLNPLISVLPRVLIGITSYYSYKFIRDKKDKNNILLYGIFLLMMVFLGRTLVRSIEDKEGFSIFINLVLLVVSLVGFIYIKRRKAKDLDLVVGVMVGSLTNTVLVLSGIYFIYGEKYVDKLDKVVSFKKFLLSVALSNGILEMIVGIILVTNIILGVRKNK